MKKAILYTGLLSLCLAAYAKDSANIISVKTLTKNSSTTDAKATIKKYPDFNINGQKTNH